MNMPAFFVISGFLYHEHNWRPTLKSFGIPLVVFSIIRNTNIQYSKLVGNKWLRSLKCQWLNRLNLLNSYLLVGIVALENALF